MAGRPDPKPARRIVDRDVLPPGWEWETGAEGRRWPVRAGQIGPPPACLACGQQNVSRFHLVPKGKGGDDLPVNVVWVCGSGTTGCHGTWELRLKRPALGCPFDPRARGEWTPDSSEAWQMVGNAIRCRLTGDQLLYVLTKAGPVYLDEVFPILYPGGG